MSLLTEAVELEARQGGTCALATLMAGLSPSEQAELTEALTAQDALGRWFVASKALSLALKARGHDVGYHTISRHRRGDCKCH